MLNLTIISFKTTLFSYEHTRLCFLRRIVRKAVRDIKLGVVKPRPISFSLPRTRLLLLLQFQVHSGWPRARIFLEPSTRGRALQLERTCAHLSDKRRRHSESWYASTPQLARSWYYKCFTFDLTDAAGRTGNPKGRRIRADGERKQKEGERSRRINLSDLGGE